MIGHHDAGHTSSDSEYFQTPILWITESSIRNLIAFRWYSPRIRGIGSQLGHVRFHCVLLDGDVDEIPKCETLLLPRIKQKIRDNRCAKKTGVNDDYILVSVSMFNRNHDPALQ